jgi:hypothetical protein
MQNPISRLMTLMLALTLVLGAVSISFADDNNQKGPGKATPNKAGPPPPSHKKKKPPNPNLPKAKTKDPQGKHY